MARSTYIYVVQLDADVVGAFTVKHEMVSRLRRVQESWPTLTDSYQVWRVPDGEMIGLRASWTSLGTASEVIASA